MLRAGPVLLDPLGSPGKSLSGEKGLIDPYHSQVEGKNTASGLDQDDVVQDRQDVWHFRRGDTSLKTDEGGEGVVGDATG